MFTSLNPSVTDIDTIYAFDTYTIPFGGSAPPLFKWTSITGQAHLVKETPLTDPKILSTCSSKHAVSTPTTGFTVTSEHTSMPDQSTSSKSPDMQMRTAPSIVSCHSVGQKVTDTTSVIAAAIDFCVTSYSNRPVHTLTLTKSAVMKFGVSSNTCRGRESPELRSDFPTATIDPAAPSVFSQDYKWKNAHVVDCLMMFWMTWVDCRFANLFVKGTATNLL